MSRAARATSVVAVAAVIVLSLQVIRQDREIRALRSRPPSVETHEVVREEVIQAPPRIVTREVFVGSEDVVPPRITYGGGDPTSRPVTVPAPRTSRWLAGMSFGDRARAWGGYSFGNRLDLCAGMDTDGRPSVLLMIRF